MNDLTVDPVAQVAAADTKKPVDFETLMLGRSRR